MSKKNFELNIPEIEEIEVASSDSLIDSKPLVNAEEAKKLSESDSRLADPIFKTLADPKLPALPSRDRAKLQIQSPFRVHFYWSIKSNPFKTLGKSIGDEFGSYTLVTRFLNLSNGDEEIHRVDARGDWWFNVRPNMRYRAEIGFYAPNRPFIRILYSNEVTTPRRSPSPRTDYTTAFATSADDFARTLDAAGYKKDAFDVALTGDDPSIALGSTQQTLESLSGGKLGISLSDSFAAEIRLVLLALASGYSLDELKGMVRDEVIELVRSNVDLSDRGRILGALEENFDLVTEEVTEWEETGDAVFGLSAVHFPKRLRSKRIPKSLSARFSEYSNPDLTSS